MRPLPLVAAAGAAAYALVRRRRLTRTGLAAIAVVVVALALYGTGVFDLPNLKEAIADLGAALGPYTYVLVGVAAFLETGAFVGLIAPGETTVIVGGVIAGQGEIKIGWLIAVVWTSAVAGDTASFFLGRRLGRQFLLKHGPRFKITEPRLEQVEAFFARHGGKTILIGRFVGVIRAVAPFIAGASKMPYRRFAPYDILGAGLWGSLFCVLGYVFWRSFDRVAAYAGQGAFALGTVIVVVTGTVVAYRWLRVEKNRAMARAWLHEQAERPLVRPVARVVRPVLFGVLIPVWARARRPARFAWRRFTPGELGLELTTLVAITAVGAYALVAPLVILSPAEPYTPIDLRALEIADTLRTATLDDVARAVTHLGDGAVVTVLVAVTALVVILRRHVVEGLVLTGGLAITSLLIPVLKAAEDRPRPVGPRVETAAESFPSGHAAHAIVYVAVALALARAVPSLAGRFVLVAGAIVLAAAIGLTRVYLRAHFMSDVVAGWGMAAAIFALCAIGGLLVAHLRHNPAR